MSEYATGLVDRAERFTWTKLRVFLAVAVPLFGIYLTTAEWGPGYGVDAFVSLQTAYHVANEKTVFVEGDARVPRPWMAEIDDERSVTQAPPGAALLATPVYFVWPGGLTEIPRNEDGRIGRASTPEGPRPYGTLLVPPLAPGALLAGITTAVAMGLLAVIFFGLAGGWAAVFGGLIAGLGTAAWSISAEFYWQHGPAMMWLALGMLLSVSHEVWSGLAFGVAGLTRPHTLVVAAATGIGRALGDRSWKPVLLIGLGSSLGLLLFLLYNRAVFDVWTVFGGYDATYAEHGMSLDLAWFGRNLLGGLLDPARGLFLYSPFLLVLLPGLVAAWRSAPAWMRGSAIGGVLYLLIQYKLHRFADGSASIGYRYPLEALVASAPLLFLSYWHWVRSRWLAHRLFVITAILSIAFQFVAAMNGFG